MDSSLRTSFRKNQLLRQFPQMGRVLNTTDARAYAKAHEMQLSFEKRFSAGWNLNFAYTRLKLVEADFYQNEFDRERTERTSNDGRPHRVTMTTLYELPLGKGKKFMTAAPRLSMHCWAGGSWPRPTSTSLVRC